VFASCKQRCLFVGSHLFACVLGCLQDWPHKWQSFIPDIVAASKTNETLCENSMHILKLLSEEVFDFSRGELTQVRGVTGRCAAHAWMGCGAVRSACLAVSGVGTVHLDQMW
jgi:hypothetical protein